MHHPGHVQFEGRPVRELNEGNSRIVYIEHVSKGPAAARYVTKYMAKGTANSRKFPRGFRIITSSRHFFPHKSTPPPHKGPDNVRAVLILGPIHNIVEDLWAFAAFRVLPGTAPTYLQFRVVGSPLDEAQQQNLVDLLRARAP